MRYVFDIECDALLDKVTVMWCIVFWDIDNKEMFHFDGDDFGWRVILDHSTLLIGHNILGYDIPVLTKLFDYELPLTTKVHDTLIMSQVLDYRRFGMRGHSLEVWGESLDYPKIEFDDYSQYTPEMLTYCKQDVSLNTKVYDVLMSEYRILKDKNPFIQTYLKSEFAVAQWQSEAQLKGWPFNYEKAMILFDELEQRKTEIHDKLYDVLGYKAVAIDKCKGVVPAKSPKWTKFGAYEKRMADYFGVHPFTGLEDEERMIWGDYSRVEFKHLELTSPADVKIFLFRHGWEPSEWNTKRDEDGRFRLTSPKIVEEDLELLGGDGALYSEFLSISSRYNVCKTWIENVDENGRLHGDSMVIGTPSMRTRHQIIVNVPTSEKPYGKEMRELFVGQPGWKLIGCDSAGNQARGLAFYLKDKEFIDVILNGDIHSYNADKLTWALNNMGIDLSVLPDSKVPRASAKRILYAFLFGASGGKLWGYIFGTPDKKLGNKLKKEFTRAVPGFKNLLDKLEKIFGATRKDGYGYIPSIAGNRIYCDSFHKLLVYLLQSLEKITCSASLMLTVERLREEGIPYQPLIMYHDEEDFMVPEEYSDRAAEIGKQAFIDGPLLYEIDIMDGDSKIGDSWYEIH